MNLPLGAPVSEPARPGVYGHAGSETGAPSEFMDLMRAQREWRLSMNCGADILSAGSSGILPHERRGKDAPSTGSLGSLPHATRFMVSMRAQSEGRLSMHHSVGRVCLSPPSWFRIVAARWDRRALPIPGSRPRFASNFWRLSLSLNQKVGLAVPGEPQSGATDPGRTLGGGGSERRFVGALGQTRPTAFKFWVLLRNRSLWRLPLNQPAGRVCLSPPSCFRTVAARWDRRALPTLGSWSQCVRLSE